MEDCQGVTTDGFQLFEGVDQREGEEVEAEEEEGLENAT